MRHLLATFHRHECCIPSLLVASRIGARSQPLVLFSAAIGAPPTNRHSVIFHPSLLSRSKLRFLTRPPPWPRGSSHGRLRPIRPRATPRRPGPLPDLPPTTTQTHELPPTHPSRRLPGRGRGCGYGRRAQAAGAPLATPAPPLGRLLFAPLLATFPHPPPPPRTPERARARARARVWAWARAREEWSGRARGVRRETEPPSK